MGLEALRRCWRSCVDTRRQRIVAMHAKPLEEIGVRAKVRGEARVRARVDDELARHCGGGDSTHLPLAQQASKGSKQGKRGDDPEVEGSRRVDALGIGTSLSRIPTRASKLWMVPK